MQGKLADMYTTLNACRAYVYAVGAGLRPRPRPRARTPPAPSSTPPRRRRGWRCEAIQALGGNGYINDYPDRPAAARRQALRDRRRHQRDPPHADRPRAVRGDRVSDAVLRSHRRPAHATNSRPTRRAMRGARRRICAQRRGSASAGGGEAARERHLARGKLLPRDRVAARCSTRARRSSRSAQLAALRHVRRRRAGGGHHHRHRPRLGPRMRDRRATTRR